MEKPIKFSPPYLGSEEWKSVEEVFHSNWLTTGEKTQAFEKACKTYLSAQHALAVNSCTSALFLALKALGVKQGDEVIVPVLTFAATVNVIEHCGATPIFVDVAPPYFLVEAEEIKKKITERTKAIIVVHFAGNVCNMDAIEEVAQHIPIIEDVAHAMGASYANGKKVGNSSNICCFSFYATKNMTTIEGGLLTTGSGEISKKVETLRFHGISKNAWNRYTEEGSWEYDVVEAGYKCNMSDVQAALGLIQLSKLEEMNKKRKVLVQRYQNRLGSNLLPYQEGSAYHLCITFSSQRDELMKILKEHRVASSVHFKPIHLMTYYKEKYGLIENDFPVALDFFQKCVSLPLHPGLSEDDVKKIGEICYEQMHKEML